MSNEPASVAAPAWARGHDASIAYHGNLLGDPTRLDAYDRALRALISAGDVVMDLGTGTGVLAMLAARAGAARVHAVESMPIADTARRLILRNGLADTVALHWADALSFAPVEPVDLVVSEFMGRFVVDDGMLAAVAASAAWMKKGARFCPSSVSLKVAPVHMHTFAPLDIFDGPLRGIDLSPARAEALNYTYAADLGAEATLAASQPLHRFVPPHVQGPVGGKLRFTIAKPGRLRAIAGWFDAVLAELSDSEAIELSTRPGTTTHWGQALFPVPATDVKPGDVVTVTMAFREGSRIGWRWHGVIERVGRVDIPFDLTADGADPDREDLPPIPRVSMAETTRLDSLGADAAHIGRPNDAIQHFAKAIVTADPSDNALIARLHRNLGTAYWLADRHREAVDALIRGLDGDMTVDEQAARLLVDVLHRSGLSRLGGEWLRRYERAFGSYPEGS